MMASAKYLRDVTVKIGSAIRVNELKIEFDIAKSNSSTANRATVRIYNMSRVQRQRIKSEELPIEVLAGYIKSGDAGLCFSGTITDVNHTYDNQEVITTIDCGDGHLTARRGYVTRTWEAGTALTAVIEDIRVDGMPNVSRGDVVGLTDNILHSDLTVAEPTKRVMDMLGRTYKFYWSVQNGALECIKGTKALNEIVRITPSTGLIGTPSVTDKGVSFVALLDAAIRPHRRVELWSQKLLDDGTNGLYRVSAVRAHGSNRDGDFYVEADAELIANDKVEDK